MKNSNLFAKSTLISSLGALLMAIIVSVTQEKTATATPLQAPMATINNCRYGVGVTGSENMLDDLRVGTALNFSSAFSNYGPGIDYVPTIRLKQKQTPDGTRLSSYSVSPALNNSGLGALLSAYPGRLWLIGNEVDRKIYQDDMMPDLYAEAYHEVYHYIKDRDPSAQVAISGLVRVSPGRLQYLDIVWDSYLEKFGTQIPVDVWNMHAYNLAELQANGNDAGASVALGTDRTLALRWGPGYITSGMTNTQINQVCNQENIVCIKEEDSLQAFKDQVVDMRQWMKSHGEQNKPLIISEYSLLSPYSPEGNSCYLADEFGNCFTPQRVDTFMRDTLDYLEGASDPALGYPADNNRLVQQWVWYPTSVTNNDAVGSSSKLVTNDGGALTQMGQTYRSYASFPSNLIVEIVGEKPSAAAAQTAPATVSLSTVVRNVGTIPTDGTTTIDFRDAQGSSIGTAFIGTGMRGCSIYPESVSVEWTNIPAGTNQYDVYINDVYSGSALVLVEAPYTVHLPIANR